MGIEVILVVAVGAILLIGGGLWLEGRARRAQPQQPERAELLTASSTSRTPKSVKAVFMLVPLGIVGLGLLVLVIAALWRMEYEASADWHTTQGVVSRSDVIGESDLTRDHEAEYKIDFEYRYQVDNVLYTGERIYFSFAALMDNAETRSTHTAAEKLIKPYPVGKTITVLYDPDDPHKAVLERRFDTSPFLLGLGGGMLAVVIGLGAVIFGLFELFNDQRVYV
jgi:hypothetical protein